MCVSAYTIGDAGVSLSGGKYLLIRGRWHVLTPGEIHQRVSASWVLTGVWERKGLQTYRVRSNLERSIRLVEAKQAMTSADIEHCAVKKGLLRHP